jgi:hypothetical protein
MKLPSVVKTNHQSRRESPIHLRDHGRKPTPEEKHLSPMQGRLLTLSWAVSKTRDTLLPEGGSRNRELAELNPSDDSSSFAKQIIMVHLENSTSRDSPKLI